MSDNDFDVKRKDFLESIEKKDSVLVLLYMVFTLGIYSIFWIFSINKKLEEVEFERPHSSWGIFVMFVLPIGWIINMIIFKILTDSSEISRLVDIVGWVVIMLLILQYLYDFCSLFGKVTKSNNLVWYYSIYSGYLGSFLFFLDIYAAVMLVFFTIVVIPAMQERLNCTKDISHQRGRNSLYFTYGKKYS